MVEVFKTNIEDRALADDIVLQLQSVFPSAKINFDLEDCDRILRIESGKIELIIVIETLSSLGFICEILE